MSAPLAMSSENDFSVKVPLRQQPLRQLNKIAKRPPVDIEFQDLTYSVPDTHVKGGKLNAKIEHKKNMN